MSDDASLRLLSRAGRPQEVVVIDEPVLASASAIYRALLADEGGDLRRLGSGAADPRRDLGPAIALLRRFGLVEDCAETESGLAPVSPEVALAGLLDGQAMELAQITELLARRQEAIRVVLTQFGEIHRGRRTEARLDVVIGHRAVTAAVDEAFHLAKQRIYTIQPGPVAEKADLERCLARSSAALDRGVRIRNIHAKGLARLPRLSGYLHTMRAAGVDIRLGRSVPTFTIVVDAALAILVLSAPSGDPTVALVRNPYLVEFVDDMFENLWMAAEPLDDLADAPGQAPDGLRGETLRMLASGMHDEGIARRLGVSLRTVGRLTAELMASLNVESRFAAGVAAARAGWLD